MLFNSIHFLAFFPIAATLYFSVPHRWRWIVLLAASYYFYGSWRVEYLGLIILSTLVDYLAGLRMSALPTRRSRLPYLCVSIAVNLGLLAVFKYAAFAGEVARDAFALVSAESPVPIVRLILPVGISFYTFQTLGYSIDVYRGTVRAERHPGLFALYVAFFPQLVAGPIERASRLLPQFRSETQFSYHAAADGLRRMAWGFFKKLVIADQAALIVNPVFAAPEDFSSFTLLAAAYLFVYQVYCDFSGYSDIAIGAARVLGFDLMENFRRPLAAASIQDLWRRWHISLSTWFRDYLYFPLGGSRGGNLRTGLNLFVVFVIAGVWHGAGWNFIAWGALHGIFLATALATFDFRERCWTRASDAVRNRFGFGLAALRSPWSVLVTFHLFTFSLIVFRSPGLAAAGRYLERLGSMTGEGQGIDHLIPPPMFAVLVAAIAFMEIADWFRERRPDSFATEGMGQVARTAVYVCGLWCILLFGEVGAREFFYFQF